MKNRKQTIYLSVAIITFNEEKNIAACIQSVEEIADEIIILDSFSQDDTIKIAKSHKKVKVFQREFPGHIEQKNRAIELCQGEWILSLDADERLSENLQKEIKQMMPFPGNINGYKIRRLTYHMGKFIRHSGWYPGLRYRLFLKNRAKWTGENPHDYIELEGKGGSLQGDMIHYSFVDLSAQIDTINKFSSIVSYTRYFAKKQKFSLIRIIFKPVSKFIEIYLIKKGFLDGFPGFVIAASSAFSTFLKYAKIYEYQKKLIERPSNLRKDYGNKTIHGS